MPASLVEVVESFVECFATPFVCYVGVVVAGDVYQLDVGIYQGGKYFAADFEFPRLADRGQVACDDGYLWAKGNGFFNGRPQSLNFEAGFAAEVVVECADDAFVEKS